MIVVFTAIIGSSDSLKAAPSGASRCVCFVDDPSIYGGQTRGWELIAHPRSAWAESDPRREAWRLRCIARQLFPTARKTVWIDASFTLTDLPKLLLDSSGHELAGLSHQARHTCYEEAEEIIRIGQADAPSVRSQMKQYRREGFAPDRLTIACILVRENTEKVARFNTTWELEIKQHLGDNTQLSIDYAAWKAGLQWHHLKGVRKDNPYAIHDHRDHKNRRKPYVSAVNA